MHYRTVQGLDFPSYSQSALIVNRYYLRVFWRIWLDWRYQSVI